MREWGGAGEGGWGVGVVCLLQICHVRGGGGESVYCSFVTF